MVLQPAIITRPIVGAIRILMKPCIARQQKRSACVNGLPRLTCASYSATRSAIKARTDAGISLFMRLTLWLAPAALSDGIEPMPHMTAIVLPILKEQATCVDDVAP